MTWTLTRSLQSRRPRQQSATCATSAAGQPAKPGLMTSSYEGSPVPIVVAASVLVAFADIDGSLALMQMGSSAGHVGHVAALPLPKPALAPLKTAPRPVGQAPVYGTRHSASAWCPTGRSAAARATLSSAVGNMRNYSHSQAVNSVGCSPSGGHGPSEVPWARARRRG